jgi:PleD family two-component response regulator
MSDNTRAATPPGAHAPLDTARETAPPLVLLASDQEWSTRSLESVLGPQGFATVRAYNGRQALELTGRTHPDVVIVDAGLPDIAGVDFCVRLRDEPDFPASTPIIMTTAGPASRLQRLEAYRAGAWEFLSLPVDAEALLLKLSAYVRAKREIDRSREESLLDDATGLYNLRGLARRAREIGADASRRHASLACVAITGVLADQSPGISEEIDPRLAAELGDLCRRTARSSDAVGRLGRSEIAILAPATDDAGALRLAERIRDRVVATEFGIGTGKLELRAGYCAFTDFSSAPVDAVEMMLRASSALRHVRSSERLVGAWTDVPAPSVK